MFYALVLFSLYILYIISFFVVLGCAEIDYARVIDGKEPLFAVFGMHETIGGEAHEYTGAGYIVIKTKYPGSLNMSGSGLYYTWRCVWPGLGRLMKDEPSLRPIFPAVEELDEDVWERD